MEAVQCVFHPLEKIEKEAILELESDVEDLVSSFVTGLGFFQDESEHSIEDDRSQVSSLFTDKKKHILKERTQNSNWILPFDSLEEQKLLKSKGEDQTSLMAKNLFSSSMHPGTNGLSVSLENNNAGISEAEACGESKAPDQESICGPSDHKTSVLKHCNSTQNGVVKSAMMIQPKSALRGSRKEPGSGPQPKLQVRWAPDVQEPACSSVSHTVRHNYHWNYLKKKEHKQHKHLHKGKSSHGDGRKKHEKKHSIKSRAQYVRYERDLHPGAATKRLIFSRNKSFDRDSTFLMGCIPENITFHALNASSGRVAISKTEPETFTGPVLEQDVFVPLRKESKYAGSYFGIGAKLFGGAM